ncbi:MAG: alanine racemase [Candidatus Delongbacteria bacterium]|jgi:alanine racemase|nr:alanine racemase [Candidatus Delongbacteria bacterium]
MEFPTEITISKQAVKNNIEFIKDYIGENIRMSSVVKANAYGHGIKEFVSIAEEYGIDHFSVFCYNEAIQVYDVVKKKTDIMIMGWIDNLHFEDIISKEIEFFVFNLERLEIALEVSNKINKPARIHLEIETGMNRNGLSKKEFIQSIKIINKNQKNFIVKGLCSHLAGSESIANHVRVKKQIRLFENYLKTLQQNNINPEFKHLACSAATIGYPKSRFNMVRIGIMQYGFWSSKEVFLRYSAKKKGFVNPLKRVITWKSEVMSLKFVKTGEFVSYGTTYLAQHDIYIAIIPIGYSNGYSRSFSNRGRVLINGIRCSVIGNVNMNMIIVDVTSLENVKIRDEVVLIGEQNDLKISVDSFSEISQQINYEILSRLPLNIPRKIIK